MSKNHSDLYAIGHVVKVFGVKGDLIVQPLTDSRTRFGKLKKVLIGSNERSVEERQIEYVKTGERGVRLKLRNINDRTAAEQFVGALLFVGEEDLRRLPQGSYYVHQVIGLHVVNQEGETIGVVKDVLKMPASDVYVIDASGKEILLPAVKEFIKRIDIPGGTMRVALIEGMVE